MSSGPAPPPPDEEDLIDKVIRTSGCEVAFRKYEDCMVDSDRDFRLCAPFSKALAVCMAQKHKDDQAAKGKS
eukprot:CAMPEP_0173430532 /NCGR_PEP_ID=MMETSP1357-20121228/8934_1 /TAXON_ID=77926 /ORGANISM="Hemiselmis rufescens, Strain PCC563" /LENGTH=71 /DNA_ID=CAMNT_0014394885 /DNA_START=209 /DNA_END=424 /DNA_ORIENTATION=-